MKISLIKASENNTEEFLVMQKIAFQNLLEKYQDFESINDAVGVSSDSLKKLSFNGIKPTSESIENGSYPLSYAYYAVVRSDLPKKNTAWSILSWLKTDKGIKATEALGYISLIK